jgi:beta-glucosidase
MTLEEKVSLLAGASLWYTAQVERLGIPAIKVTDGPNGARGDGFAGGITAACFPVGIALAATWNTELVERVGQALGQEAVTKGAQLLLAPTVNIHRSPLNGRNFECYSEDPYLSARMAVAYIQGVQSQGVGACVKHYVCNDSEFERQSISSEVGERALREIYLLPFKAAVREAGAWALMASYNKVNGTYACENPYLLRDILREEWGFDGIVMSDWFGTTSTAGAVNGGLDLEMPGPTLWRGERLLAAVREGEVEEAAIEESVRFLLQTIDRAGAFEHLPSEAEQAVDRPEHRALARQAAREGIVLLKNEDGLLPLDTARLSSIAVIGPNARIARIMGGGSSRVNPHYAVTPYAGIVARVGDAAEVRYAVGCTNHRMLPVLDASWLTPAGNGGKRGLTAQYYDNVDLSGEPVGMAVVESMDQAWLGKGPPQVERDRFSCKYTGTFAARETGRYTFGLASAGLSRLYVDGEQVIDNWTEQVPGESFEGTGSTEVTRAVEMMAGHSYEIRLEYSKADETLYLAGVRLGCLPPVPEDAIWRAAALAAASDVAVICAGLSDEWESEGFDRPDMELTGDQVALISAVAVANPKTIVVLQSGSPLSMGWLDEVAAVMQAWYPGQECGNAIADVLFGDVDPSGRLPQTFPVRLEDNPAYINYPGENGRVYYGEGLSVGYRYYDKKRIEPLFPFGYGLSYTSFAYRDLNLSASEIAPEDELRVSVDVTNTGDRAGRDVVQIYVRDLESTLTRPDKELKAFAKVSLEPSETKTVTVKLDRTSLAYYDDLDGHWIAEAGTFEVLVGRSSRDIRASARFTLTGSLAFDARPKGKRIQLSTSSTMHQLLANAASRAILDKHFPGLSDSPQLSMAMGFTLEQLANFRPKTFTEEKLEAVAADLAELAPIEESDLLEPPKPSVWQRLLGWLGVGKRDDGSPDGTNLYGGTQ